MPDIPADSRAFRRELLAGLIGILLGTIAGGIVVTWLTVRFVVPDVGPWWAVLHWLRYMIFAVFGGLLFGLGAMKAASWWYHRRGAYRCWSCGRVRPSADYEFPCLPHYRQRQPMRFRWRHRSRHYRHNVGAALAAYAGVLGIDIVVLRFAVVDHEPYVVRLLVGHVGLCILVGAVVHGAIAFAELFKAGRKWRLRAGAFLRTFALWPAFGLVLLLLCHWL